MNKEEAKKLADGTYVMNVYLHRIWRIHIVNDNKYIRHIKDCKIPKDDPNNKLTKKRQDILFDDVNWQVLEVIPDREVFVELL